LARHIELLLLLLSLTFVAVLSMCHVHAADVADCRFFCAWSFLQSAITGMGHDTLESAGFFKLLPITT